MHPIIEKVFERRGITPELWNQYNDPDHKQLKEIDELCTKLKEIRDREEKIVILPDFDMDGVMSATVGYSGLSLLGFDVELYVPNPANGYGFGPKEIDEIRDKFPLVDAIITCDTGIGCRTGIEHAKRCGIDVLVTDHHQEQISDVPGTQSSPRGIADAIVNPCAIGEDYDHPAICGAHVLWQVIDRFAELYESDHVREQVQFIRIFAGVGTMSDTMPVLWENRQLVKDSIEICRKIWTTSPDFLDAIKDAPDGYADAFRGVYALLNIFSGTGKLQDPADVDEMFYGYYLSPAFNAVKRMDGDMSRAYGVFLGQTPSDNVKYLLEMNELRKRTFEEELAKLDAQDNPFAPFCYVSDAMHGVLGLLAMKLAQRSGLPCVVVSEHPNGRLTGSGRSPEWYPVAEMSPDFAGCFAGHAGAFGCRFESMEHLEEFYDYTKKRSQEAYDELVREGKIDTPYDIVISDDGSGDFSADLDDLLAFVKELDDYRPFGRGFEEPQVLLSFDADKAKWTPIGQEKNHLKVTVVLEDGKKLEVLCWNQASAIEDGVPSGRAYALGTFGINEFRGIVKPQMSAELMLDFAPDLPESQSK